MSDEPRPPSLARLLLLDAPADLAATAAAALRRSWLRAVCGYLACDPPLRAGRYLCGCRVTPNDWRACARHARASGGGT